MMRTILSFFACLLLAYAPSCSCSTPLVTACYFADWSAGRAGAGSYDISKIDVCSTPCSHYLYSFAKYDKKEGLIIEDIGKGYVKILTDCAKHDKVVLLAFGGWVYSGADMMEALFESKETIDDFIIKMYHFLIHHNFHGVDLDMEYPGWWQMTKKSPTDAKQKFSYLIEHLKKKLQESNLMLTVAVSANSEVLGVSYDVEVINKHADWIGLMSYDYYSHNDKKTGLCAPFTNQKGETKEWNVKASVELWLNNGASPNKMVMGFPLYGKTFKLDDANRHNIGDPASGKPDPGPFTGEAGVLSYQEICINIKDKGWTEVYTKDLGTYAYHELDWVGYDNLRNLEEKAEYILEKQLLGGMFWELSLDDFNNLCGCGSYPMLKAFQNAFPKTRVDVSQNDNGSKDDKDSSNDD